MYIFFCIVHIWYSFVLLLERQKKKKLYELKNAGKSNARLPLIVQVVRDL